MRALTVLFIGLAACTLLAACQPVRQPPALTMTLAKDEDAAQVRWQEEAAVVDIYSPSGIGAATVAWPGDLPGGALVLRLHLKGLEGLQVAGGDRQAALAVDNAPPYAVRVEGEAADPQVLGIDVRRGDGVFTVRLDQSWLQGGDLEVRWIDFYR